MSLFQAFLIGVVYWMAADNFTEDICWIFGCGLANGLLVGIILGDPVRGAMVGGTINLLFLGFISAGGAIPSDAKLVSVLGTAMAISGNLSTDAAVALAVPLSLCGTIFWQIRMTTSSIFVRLTDKFIDEGKYDKLIWSQCILPWLYTLCLYAIPCMLAAYYGVDFIASFINSLSGTVLTVLSVIGGLMPAVGVAITLQYIFKGESCIFLFIGFIIAAISGQSLLILGVLGALIAVGYVQLKGKVAK